MAPPRVVGAVIDRLNVNKQLHAISEGLVNFYVASHVLAMLGASVCLSVCLSRVKPTQARITKYLLTVREGLCHRDL